MDGFLDGICELIESRETNDTTNPERSPCRLRVLKGLLGLVSFTDKIHTNYFAITATRNCFSYTLT